MTGSLPVRPPHDAVATSVYHAATHTVAARGLADRDHDMNGQCSRVADESSTPDTPHYERRYL